MIHSEVNCPACSAKYSVEVSKDTLKSITEKELFLHCSKCDHLFEGLADSNQEHKKNGHNTTQATETTALGEPAPNYPSDDGIQFSLPFPTRRKDIIRTFKGSESRDKSKQQKIDSTPSFQQTLNEQSRAGASLKAQESLLPNDSIPPRTPLAPDLTDQEATNTLPPPLPPEAQRRSSLQVSLYSLGALTFLFFLFGQFLKLDLGVATTLSSVLATTSKSPAPAELRINSLELEKLTLESGEDLSLIRGTLTNDSKLVQRDVMLEVALFNKDGSLLEARQIPLSAPDIRGTRLESLPAQTILEMQKRALSGKNSINSGESVNFQIALSADDLNGASFYTTRVHSVRSQG